MNFKRTIFVPSETKGYGENKRELPAMQVVVELDINVDEIAKHFGRKAARSKSGRSTALGRRIKIKVHGVAK